LYYARAVDPTVLMSLNDIATEQTKATEKTQAATNQLLDYLATHPDATIRYYASHLSVSNAGSLVGGLLFKATNPPNKTSLMVPSLMSLPSLKTWSPPWLSQKLEHAFTTPKVTHHLELHSPNWATSNPHRLSEKITPPYLESWMKPSSKKDQKQWTCDTIGWPTESINIIWHLLAPRTWKSRRLSNKNHSAQHHKNLRGFIWHQANSLQVLQGCVKLLPLPQPQLRTHTNAQTNPSAQRATQLRSVLARVCYVSRQN
jgi:hypothetical protein